MINNVKKYEAEVKEYKVIVKYDANVYNETEINNDKHMEKLKVDGKAYKNRLEYEGIWDKNNNKRLTYILFNPSTANQYCPDPTISNCIKITKALKEKYGGIIVYNTFTVRHPDVKTAISKIDITYEKKYNSIFRLSENEKVKDIVVAWGNDVKKLDKEYVDMIKDSIIKSKRNIFAFRLNTDGETPTHPGPNCNRYVKDFCENPKLKKYFFK